MRLASWLFFIALASLAAAGCRPITLTVRAASPQQSASALPAGGDRSATIRPLRGHPGARLTDVTATSGVRFRHHTGAFGRKWFPETNGAGAALFDYDGDGNPDLFLVNDRDWPPAARRAAHLRAAPPAAPTPSRLYRNRGDSHFEDVTHAAGLDVPMYGMGCAVGDYNNDGCPDLYVSGVGRGWLFRNEGGRRFREVAGPAGVQGGGWGSGCAWVDVDRDGYLDLFVCHYVKWDPARDTPCDGDGGRLVYCGPNLYPPEPCRLYQNHRDGTFRDISEHAGIWKRDGRLLTSKALGVAVCDEDEDGWPDLAVANDTEANFLFRNQHAPGTGPPHRQPPPVGARPPAPPAFREEGLAAGIALPSHGEARSGMGIDAGDWDGSGRQSLLIGNFWDEKLALYRLDERGLYTDVAEAAGIGEPSRSFTTFGCLFVDLNNDGWLDIAAANGHIDQKTEQGSAVALAQRPLFFLNQAGKSFREARLYDHPLVGRGLAAGDWNRDGAVDLLFTTNGGAPVLLENGGGPGQSMRLVLEGTRSNRSGIGAAIIARVGEQIRRRWVRSGSSYLSASELPVTLGLGTAAQAEQVTVRWPSGRVEELGRLAAGNEYRVREGAGVVRTMPLRGR
jgi:enediyne biosynthesis protein E4